MINCSLCGRQDEPHIIPWAIDMGLVCRLCFDDIIQFPPKKVVRSLMSPEEKKEAVKSRIAKACATRSIRAQEKKIQKEELRQMKRNENPEKYDAIMAKRRAALEKARAVRFGNKTEELNPKYEKVLNDNFKELLA